MRSGILNLSTRSAIAGAIVGETVQLQEVFDYSAIPGSGTTCDLVLIGLFSGAGAGTWRIRQDGTLGSANGTVLATITSSGAGTVTSGVVTMTRPSAAFLIKLTAQGVDAGHSLVAGSCLITRSAT